MATLLPLRTREELRTSLKTTSVYTLPIPSRSTNEVLQTLRPLVNTSDLQHLRRIVRPSFLPAHVLTTLPPPAYTPAVSIQYVLACTVEKLSEEDLRKALINLQCFSSHFPAISIIQVPSYEPTSAEQAADMTTHFWPTVYKNGNPFGPHPAIVKRAGEKMQDRAGEYMALAKAVAREAADAGVGHRFGGVIVNPDTGEVVACAGDARCKENEKGWTNPLEHTVMRLAAMVAQKRLPTGIEVSINNPVQPLTGLEQRYFGGEAPAAVKGGVEKEVVDKECLKTGVDQVDGVSAVRDGYLCHNMHVYLTHEPCVMCGMALLHSRVGAVVFGKRMPMTGSLMAGEEDGLGHGLFWRTELNWKFLCWQFKEEGDGEGDVEFEGVSV